MSVEQESVVINLDGVQFLLRAKQNFGWLRELGRVFAVFDKHDSGNLSFGLERDGHRKFIKYAGAETLEYEGTTQDAIQRLKQAIPVYQELKHPCLIEFEDHFETPDGYAAVFDWFEGECLHSHWQFSSGIGKHHPAGPYYRYRQLPIAERLRSLDQIFSFHTFVEAKSYVAIDLYDGSILYNFQHHITKICDIDFYRKRPVVNDAGDDFWGSYRFKSPEEDQLGSPIDERTNVYTMGALAFWLLGGELDHSVEKWEAGDKLYMVASKATEKDRNQRHACVSEFFDDWRHACEGAL